MPEDILNPFGEELTDLPDDNAIEAIFQERRTQHADDAIDYEDIDELADEEPRDKLSDDDNEFDNLLGDVEENQLQEQADQDFDDIYGSDDDQLHNTNTNAHDIFNNLNGNQFVDDGLGGIFDDKEYKQQDDSKMLSPEESRKLHEEESRKRILQEEIRKHKRQKLSKVIQKLEARRLKRNIKYHYPGYSKNKSFNFHLFFVPEPKYYSGTRPSREYLKPLLPTKMTLEFEPDQKKAFKSKKSALQQGRDSAITSITEEDLEFIKELRAFQNETHVKEISFLNKDWSQYDKFTEYNKDLILSTTDWDDAAILNAGDEKYKPRSVEFDQDVAIDDYDDENIFNGTLNTETLRLDMNDPNLLFVPSKKFEKSKAIMPTTEKLLEMKFNFSNDKEYEMLKNNYNTKVRSQLSNLNIEHSIPALRLQSPYYKVKLNTVEGRAFHRPRFVGRKNAVLTFSKLKQRKKKKDRGRSLQEVFSKTSDLTAADTGNLIGMEYSEEYPQIMSNFGMCSKLINYYRKERDDDTSRPKTQIGETHVLGVEDRSPFWNFGEVAPGDFVPTLYNNMVRAPIFKHDVKSTDFLLIQSLGSGNHQRHYLRSLNYIFSVGNTFPAVEVPAPHSRKVTNTSKNRLKMVVFRVMNNKGIARVSVKDVSRHFPDQNDMQNRQRLKEFMEYQRQGDDQGFWKIKNAETVPTEEDIRTMITPEDCVLLDSMQHGVQVLDDIQMLFGDEDTKKEKIKKVDEEEEEKLKKEKTEKGEKIRRPRDPDAEIDLDEEMAPWNLTRNFINANQTKTMLQLNGEGDPTGIGLGFSFLRSTQKNGFHPLFAPSRKELPKSNTALQQQKLYEGEIKRIWYSQRSSLVDHGPGFSLQGIYDEYKPVNQEKVIKSKLKEAKETRARARANAAKVAAAAAAAAAASANASNDPQVPVPVPASSPDDHILRITRRVRDENGILQRRVETVTDPRLIKAYIRRRKTIEDEMLKTADVLDILPTNDKELNKIRKRALEDKLANFMKRSKQGRSKKPAKDSIHAAAAAGGKIIDANTVILPDGSYAIGGKGIGKGNSRTRRCTLCGAFGHIRTNKTCPLYVQTEGGTVPLKKEDATPAVVAAVAAAVTAGGDSPSQPNETGLFE